MRFVLDTNLLVSALIADDVPSHLLDAARAGAYELCTSEVLLTELTDVLSRSHLAGRLARASIYAVSSVDDLRRIAIVVTPNAVPRVVASDPGDDHVLTTAMAAGADLITSGDQRDLLLLGSYPGILIATAREALKRLQR